MEKHYHIIDSGGAVMSRNESRREAVQLRRRIYADMKSFVDTRPLARISVELPIVQCHATCEWE